MPINVLQQQQQHNQVQINSGSYRLFREIHSCALACVGLVDWDVDPLDVRIVLYYLLKAHYKNNTQRELLTEEKLTN